jgi:hypothetical protein
MDRQHLFVLNVNRVDELKNEMDIQNLDYSAEIIANKLIFPDHTQIASQKYFHEYKTPPVFY